jgi:hypothetical protein
MNGSSQRSNENSYPFCRLPSAFCLIFRLEYLLSLGCSLPDWVGASTILIFLINLWVARTKYLSLKEDEKALMNTYY